MPHTNKHSCAVFFLKSFTLYLTNFRYKHLLFLGSGAVALAYLDGSGTDEAVCSMVQRVQELALGYPEGRIELQLIGGFSDPSRYSEELFYNIMSKLLFRSRPGDKNRKKLFCLRKWNRVFRNYLNFKVQIRCSFGSFRCFFS